MYDYLEWHHPIASRLEFSATAKWLCEGILSPKILGVFTYKAFATIRHEIRNCLTNNNYY